MRGIPSRARSYLFYDFCGVADGDAVRGNGMCDDRPRADDAVLADGDAGKNFHAAAEPDVIAHRDGLRKLEPALADGWIRGVCRRIETAGR